MGLVKDIFNYKRVSRPGRLIIISKHNFLLVWCSTLLCFIPPIPIFLKVFFLDLIKTWPIIRMFPLPICVVFSGSCLRSTTHSDYSASPPSRVFGGTKVKVVQIWRTMVQPLVCPRHRTTAAWSFNFSFDVVSSFFGYLAKALEYSVNRTVHISKNKHFKIHFETWIFQLVFIKTDAGDQSK